MEKAEDTQKNTITVHINNHTICNLQITNPPYKGGFFMFWKTVYIYLRIYHDPM